MEDALRARRIASFGRTPRSGRQSRAVGSAARTGPRCRVAACCPGHPGSAEPAGHHRLARRAGWPGGADRLGERQFERFVMEQIRSGEQVCATAKKQLADCEQQFQKAAQRAAERRPKAPSRTWSRPALLNRRRARPGQSPSDRRAVAADRARPAAVPDAAGPVPGSQQLRPVADAYRRYLPDASRMDRLPSYGGYGLLVLPVPLVSAEEGLTEQVQAAVRVAGPVWLAGAEEDTKTRRRGDTESGAGRKIDGRKMGGCRRAG